MVEEHRSELPFDEAHWSELTLRALRELGGDSQMVVGAKLRQKMVELAHFLLAHDREDERPRYRREFGRRSLRAVWLDRQLMSDPRGRYMVRVDIGGTRVTSTSKRPKEKTTAGGNDVDGKKPARTSCGLRVIRGDVVRLRQ